MRDKKHKNSKIYTLILLSTIILTISGCSSNNDELYKTDQPTTEVVEEPKISTGVAIIEAEESPDAGTDANLLKKEIVINKNGVPIAAHVDDEGNIIIFDINGDGEINNDTIDILEFKLDNQGEEDIGKSKGK